MELITWLEAKRGRAKSLAERLGVSGATVSEWANRKKPIPVDRCTPIEQFTDGAVTRPEMRADWQTHWPELLSRPHGISFAALPALVQRRAIAGGS